MKTEQTYIALLLPKVPGIHRTQYLVKSYSALGITCDFKATERANALLLSKEEAERQVLLHNSFCKDSDFYGVAEIA